MTEIGRFLAFLVTCSVIGLLMLAVLKVAARLGREALRGLQSRRDLRQLQPYSSEPWPNAEYQQIRRGGDEL